MSPGAWVTVHPAGVLKPTVLEAFQCSSVSGGTEAFWPAARATGSHTKSARMTTGRPFIQTFGRLGYCT
jgi:hypothetical protein